MKKIVFYNHFHNGDLHLSRSFVREIVCKVRTQRPDVTFTYAHRNDPELLKDIDGLNYDQSILNDLSEKLGPFVKNDTLYINTWYGQNNYKYMNKYRISFDTLYATFHEACNTFLGFKLQEISENAMVFYPSVNYSTYKIDTAKNWLDNHQGKKVLVANGSALSGQAHNFNMTNMVGNLAKKYPDITFILTNFENEISLPNVLFSSEIIQKSGNDLNENGFISEHCDVIIGRASGVFTFAMTRDNMFRDVKFICFSDLNPLIPGKFWLDQLFSNKIDFRANILNEHVSDPNVAQEIIEKNL